jgi:hypothetical protein
MASGAYWVHVIVDGHSIHLVSFCPWSDVPFQSQTNTKLASTTVTTFSGVDIQSQCSQPLHNESHQATAGIPNTSPTILYYYHTPYGIHYACTFQAKPWYTAEYRGYTASEILNEITAAVSNGHLNLTALIA